jgi:hypothetical protein
MIQGDSGIANIPTLSTINSTTVAASVVVRGYDADATTLPLHVGGVTLGIAGGGTDPLLAQPALGNGTTDVSLTGQASNYYIDSGTTVGNIGTNDPKFKVIGKVTGTTSVIAAKRNGAVGWEIGIDASDRMYCTIDDGVGSATIVSAALEIGTFIDADLYLDRSGSGQWYVDNAASGSPVVISGAALTLDSATSLSILADSGGNSPTDFGLVYFSLTHSAAWFSTHLNATDHATDFYKWSGLYPKRATGTALPTFYTRAGSAYATKWNGSSYDMLNCAAGVPRVDHVLDDSSAAFKGMLIEPAATNLFTYSNDINNAAWVKVRSTVDTSAGTTTPDSNIDYQGIVASSDASTTHHVSDSVTTTAVDYCFSGIFKQGDQPAIKLNNFTTGAFGFFDLTDGTIGTNSGLTDYGSVNLGGDNWLIWIVMTCTAAANNFILFPCPSKTSDTFTGDDSTVSTYAAFMQIELGTKPSSRIVTTGATVTRPADSLQYNGDNVTAGQGAFVADVLIDDHVPDDGMYLVFGANNAGTSYMNAFAASTTGLVRAQGFEGSTQWNMLGSTDIVDGDTHKVREIWEANNAKLYIDGSLEGTPDTSSIAIGAFDKIDVGQNFSASQQLNGRIRNIQIWPWAEENLG